MVMLFSLGIPFVVVELNHAMPSIELPVNHNMSQCWGCQVAEGILKDGDADMISMARS